MSRLEALDGEAFIREARHRASCVQPTGRMFYSVFTAIVMVIGNVAMPFYCADEFTSRHWFEGDTANDLRLALLITLGCGSLLGNLFSKVPVLSNPVLGLGLNKQQQRLYYAMEHGVQKSTKLYPSKSINIRLLDADMACLAESHQTLIVKLLSATYGVSISLEATCLEDENTARYLDSGRTDNQPVRDDVTVICINHRIDGGQTAFYQTALAPCDKLAKHPGKTLVNFATWLGLRGGLGLSTALALNQSVHNIAQNWLGFSVESSKPVMWLMLAVGLGLGASKADSSFRVICHTTDKEARLLAARVEKKQCPTMHWGAAAAAITPQTVSMFFNVSMAIFFGAGGVKALGEQIGWAVNGTAFEAPDELNEASIAWFLICNVATTLACTVAATYRKMEALITRQSDGRQADDSMTRHRGVWALALMGIIVDSLNLGLVAANSVEEAWSDLFGEDAALALAAICGVGMATVGFFWSKTTLQPSFSATVYSLSKCAPCNRLLGVNRSGSDVAESDLLEESLLDEGGLTP